jgi:hypothetical protein
MKALRYVAEVAVYGLFLFILCFAFFRCQETAKGAEFFRFRQGGVTHFVDSPKLIPRAATEVEKVRPEREFTRSERPGPAVRYQLPGLPVVVEDGGQTTHHVGTNSTENGPFTCVRERRQVGAINMPVYVTRNGDGEEVNETPSVWGCPQTSINR